MLDLELGKPMPNEADTCRTYVIPKLKSAGWEDLRLRMLLPSVLDKAFKGEL
jgi:hypothetical protein